MIIILSLSIHKNYPIFEAYFYNRHISVSGVKFLMTEDELTSTLFEEGEFINGMGGNGFRFSASKIFVGTSSIGLFIDKVVLIETENSSHSILGIKVGDEYDSALNVIKKNGFKELTDDIFTKDNIQIQLFGESKISRLRISIQDPAYKNVVF